MLFSYSYFSRIKFHRRCLMFIQAHLAFAQQHRYSWITVDIVVHRTIPSKCCKCSRHTSAINRSGMINAEFGVALLHIVPHRTHTVTHVSLGWSCSKTCEQTSLRPHKILKLTIFYGVCNFLFVFKNVASHGLNHITYFQ